MNDEIKLKEFGVTKELFNEWRTPRFGKSNPEKVVSKVWQWLATSRLSGYASNEIMKRGSSFGREATWSFDRFGQTETKLPDGRIIYIGGEHEDYYDPDFYIYNDVAILNTDGSFEFYNYPESEFLPTDFHSATLVGNKIIIIGSLSYPKVRKSNSTQVYVLDIESFKIISIDTSGDAPGWIHGHTARLGSSGESIIIKKGLVYLGDDKPLRENIDDWSLNLKTKTWRRLTTRNWRTLELMREDKSRNRFWEIRQAIWNNEVKWRESYEKSIQQLENDFGQKPQLDIFEKLYEFDFDHSPVKEHDEENNTYWIEVGEVIVRFLEDHYYLRVIIEGDLAKNKIEHIQESLKAKLSELENCVYILEAY